MEPNGWDHLADSKSFSVSLDECEEGSLYTAAARDRGANV